MSSMLNVSLMGWQKRCGWMTPSILNFKGIFYRSNFSNILSTVSVPCNVMTQVKSTHHSWLHANLGETRTHITVISLDNYPVTLFNTANMGQCLWTSQIWLRFTKKNAYKIFPRWDGIKMLHAFNDGYYSLTVHGFASRFSTVLGYFSRKMSQNRYLLRYYEKK